MNLKETDLNLFIAFDVIYTEKNLTKAGQVLGIHNQQLVMRFPD